MKYVEVITDAGSADTVAAISEKHEVSDFRLSIVGNDGMQSMRLLVGDDKLQSVLDALQTLLGKQASTRIVVLPVEIALPKLTEEEREEEDSAAATREALYEEVEKNARLDLNFIVLVVLSTAVAAIGLIENNVAVVIGAMVIAPLLGPNLAFGLGTALGDIALMRKSVLTSTVGIALAIILSIIIGIAWPLEVSSPELVSRTQVGMDSVALALASGAAAALSMTTGLSSVLVGVMVAVALLPPAVTLGLMLGYGNINLAISAALLLAINLVCVNLSSKVVFFVKGIRPRTGWEKKKAKHSMVIYILVWLFTLIFLVLFIYVRRAYTN
ncbi:TIGR00341 family protein [Sulfurirhabdus autotrophica]|uniref:Putative hydrophobic protein (TIGR00341 family) n=1 Tax=Sulfurirhabdus autotrophica TaxID=1706046 RepID=A0A4R3YAL4_9PROT|nr:TIGR00341 family protein [Sulfurirhabdus autotrophica]TCV88048.1 putative hydrophobic protein (TIGR00341 family) [Sulfurirhabdus autotrophica]